MQAMPGPSTSLRVLVIVPAWNEQDSVGATVREIRETNPDVDILVVDDGSGDDTVERAAAAGAEVCRLPFNLGVGGAMRTGYRYALRHGYDVAVQIDADGQHDPRYLPTLIAGLDDADIVIGARFARTGDPTSCVARGGGRWCCWRGSSRVSRTPGSPTSRPASGHPTDGRSPCSPRTTPPSTSATPSSRSSSPSARAVG